MPLVNVTCKKCGETSKLDLGNYTREEVEKWLKQDGGFNCFGNHVEFGSRADYWTIDWDSVEEGNAPSEEEFVKDLKEKYEEVYENKELDKFYEVINFAFGMCVAENRDTSERKIFDFTHSPKGTRYYFA